jgi:hypothetical protein
LHIPTHRHVAVVTRDRLEGEYAGAGRKSIAGHQAWSVALDVLRGREADALLVARLDRLRGGER